MQIKTRNTTATSNSTNYAKTTIGTKQLLFKNNTTAIMIIIITPSMREVKGLFSSEMLFVTEEVCVT